MSWLSKILGIDKLTNAGTLPKLNREETLYYALKLLKPDQRAALRLQVDEALRGVDDPKYKEAARAFLVDVKSAVNR
jgi:hypothetical protein